MSNDPPDFPGHMPTVPLVLEPNPLDLNAAMIAYPMNMMHGMTPGMMMPGMMMTPGMMTPGMMTPGMMMAPGMMMPGMMMPGMMMPGMMMPGMMMPGMMMPGMSPGVPMGPMMYNPLMQSQLYLQSMQNQSLHMQQLTAQGQSAKPTEPPQHIGTQVQKRTMCLNDNAMPRSGKDVHSPCLEDGIPVDDYVRSAVIDEDGRVTTVPIPLDVVHGPALCTFHDYNRKWDMPDAAVLAGRLKIAVQNLPFERRDHLEADCTAMVHFILREAGYARSMATVTGSRELDASFEFTFELSFDAAQPLPTDAAVRTVFLSIPCIVADRHGFHHAVPENRARVESYCKTIRRQPQRVRHWLTDSMPSLPLRITELAWSPHKL